ncbi:MAG TPA: hypothetical protein VNI84_01365 [Pyrinomonadaceae bacterium]|nr:hypothetical protein [Pyrinomonadaceae bacterium]
MFEETDVDAEVYPIPERFRASADPADESAFAVLQKSDEAQKLWSEQFASPLAAQTSKERERARANNLISSLESDGDLQNLTESQREQLAEAYAVVGSYDRAAGVTGDEQKLDIYEKYWEAVWLDDEDWCSHPEKHKFIKEYIWSVRDGEERPLLACNVCRMLNVADAPAKLLEDQTTRARIRQATKGMDMREVKNYLDNNFGRGRG